MKGGDWREAFDGLRCFTPKLWQSLAPAERQIAVRKGKRAVMNLIMLNMENKYFYMLAGHWL